MFSPNCWCPVSWACLAASYGFKAIGIESCFGGIMLLLKHSVPAEMAGIAQGVGGACLGAGVATGPLWGPPLFGFCSRWGDLVVAVPFVLLGALQFSTAALTRTLTRRLASTSDLQEAMLHN